MYSAHRLKLKFFAELPENEKDVRKNLLSFVNGPKDLGQYLERE